MRNSGYLGDLGIKIVSVVVGLAVTWSGVVRFLTLSGRRGMSAASAWDRGGLQGMLVESTGDRGRAYA